MSVTPVAAVDSWQELRWARDQGMGEVIIAPRDFARRGMVELAEGVELARAAKGWGLRASLQWDILMTEGVFQERVAQLAQVDLSDFCALRVQDAGALQWSLEQTELGLHWIVEAGNHNLLALERWVDYIGERLGAVGVVHWKFPASNCAITVND